MMLPTLEQIWEKLKRLTLQVNFLLSKGIPGSGTVTEVNIEGGTGISVSGSPINTSGTITITNTFSGGLFPTTGTGTATGNVIAELDGSSLTIQDGACQYYSIATSGADFTNNLTAISTELNGGTIQLFGNATYGENSSYSFFNEEEKYTSIVQHSDASSSTISYTAGSHTFTGDTTCTATASSEANLSIAQKNIILKTVDEAANTTLLLVSDVDGNVISGSFSTTDGTSHSGIGISGSTLGVTNIQLQVYDNSYNGSMEMGIGGAGSYIYSLADDIIFAATNGISTDYSNFYQLGGPTTETVTPNTTILITINGIQYKVLAFQVP